MKSFSKKLFRFLVAMLLFTQVACFDLLSGVLGNAATQILNSGFATPTSVGPESSGLNNTMLQMKVKAMTMITMMRAFCLKLPFLCLQAFRAPPLLLWI